MLLFLVARLTRAVLAAFLMGTTLSAAPAGAVTYVMTDLGTLGGTYSSAAAINAVGQVVGSATLAGNGTSHAFLYSGGVMTDLGTLGGSGSSASAINDAGQVVGSGNLAGDLASHAFLYSRGVMTDLGTLGGMNSDARAMNAVGQVVGSAETTPDPSTTLAHPFLYSDGVMTDLLVEAFPNSGAIGINDAGMVIGETEEDLGGDYPLFVTFIYSGGVLTNLNDCGNRCVPTGINAAGQVVGWGEFVFENFTAFLQQRGRDDGPWDARRDAQFGDRHQQCRPW
jgi:probable HAF family extracellular repeat protein